MGAEIFVRNISYQRIPLFSSDYTLMSCYGALEAAWSPKLSSTLCSITFKVIKNLIYSGQLSNTELHSNKEETKRTER